MSNKKTVKQKRGVGQKIAWFFAMFSYLCALSSAVFAYYWKIDNGTQSPIFASALACIFFFITCGFVLQYISNTHIPTFEKAE